MKNPQKAKGEAAAGAHCDACQRSPEEGEHLFAILKAGYETRNAEERYELHLCESCFFGMLAYIKRERFARRMFDDDYDYAMDDSFGKAIR